MIQRRVICLWIMKYLFSSVHTTLSYIQTISMSSHIYIYIQHIEHFIIQNCIYIFSNISFLHYRNWKNSLHYNWRNKKLFMDPARYRYVCQQIFLIWHTIRLSPRVVHCLLQAKANEIFKDIWWVCIICINYISSNILNWKCIGYVSAITVCIYILQ